MPPHPLAGFSLKVTSSRKATLTALLLIRYFGPHCPSSSTHSYYQSIVIAVSILAFPPKSVSKTQPFKFHFIIYIIFFLNIFTLDYGRTSIPETETRNLVSCYHYFCISPRLLHSFSGRVHQFFGTLGTSPDNPERPLGPLVEDKENHILKRGQGPGPLPSPLLQGLTPSLCWGQEGDGPRPLSHHEAFPHPCPLTGGPLFSLASLHWP